MAFVETAQQSLAVSGVSASILLNQSGAPAPNVAFISSGTYSTLQALNGPQGQSTDQANSIFYSVGAAPVTVTAATGALLKPGQSVAVPLLGAAVYVSAIGSSGNAVNILLGTQ